jgi:hypothetical protein
MTYLSQFFHYFSGMKGAGIAMISHVDEDNGVSRPNNAIAPAGCTQPKQNKTKQKISHLLLYKIFNNSLSLAIPPKSESRVDRAQSNVSKQSNTNAPPPAVPKVPSHSPRPVIESEASPTCSKCGNPLSGQTVEWMGNLYHNVHRIHTIHQLLLKKFNLLMFVLFSLNDTFKGLFWMYNMW